MEGREAESGNEKRLSFQSASSAVEAMQRAADRLIANTEFFRARLRESNPDPTNGYPQHPLRNNPVEPLASAGCDESTAVTTPEPQPFPFAGGSSSENVTSSHGSNQSASPLPPLPTELPFAPSPTAPRLVEAQTYPEADAGRIGSRTSSGSSGSYVNADVYANQPEPVLPSSPSTWSSAQYRPSYPDSPMTNAVLGATSMAPMTYPAYRSSFSLPRKPVGSGANSVRISTIAVKGPEQTPTDGQRPPLSPAREVFFVAVICFAQLLMFAAIAQALAPAQEIGASFPDTTPGYLSWYSAAYALGVGAFSLPAGRLGTLLGHKKVFIAGFAWLSLWSTLAGLSVQVQRGGGGGTVFFCVCRAMQGVGPAMTVPSAKAMLGRVYDLGERRNVVMCLFGTAAPLGFVAGAVMASLFAELTSWEWSFFVLGAVCLTFACQSIIVLPADLKPKHPPHLDRFWILLDAPGIVFAVSGLVLFAFAWNQAPVALWTTPYVYFLLIIGVIFLGAFAYIESAAQNPLLPLSAMTATTGLVLACTAAGWGCFAVWAYYTFQFLVVLRGYSPLLASAGFAPLPLVGLLASFLVAYLLRRVTPYWLMLIATVAFAAGSALMAAAPVGQTYWLCSFFSILLVPLGMGISSPVANVLVTSSLPEEHHGIAGSLVLATVFTSMSVSLGVAGTVVSNVDGAGVDVLAGHRGAMYVAVGLAGLGMLLAFGSAVVDTLWPAEPEEGAVLRIGGRRGPAMREVV